MAAPAPAPAPAPAGLLLAPGAGADRDQPGLVAIDEAVTATGLAVRRMDFPDVLAGRRVPDRPPVLLQAVHQAQAELAAELKVAPQRLVLGGRSTGGRICWLAVADGCPAAALMLLSYPLHPPGRPERRRVAHFSALAVPCRFVSGTRHAFGRPDEVEEAAAAIPGPVTHRWIDGADHSRRRREATVAELVVAWFGALGARRQSASACRACRARSHTRRRRRRVSSGADLGVWSVPGSIKPRGPSVGRTPVVPTLSRPQARPPRPPWKPPLVDDPHLGPGLCLLRQKLLT